MAYKPNKVTEGRPWHALSADETLQALESRPTGLTEEEAAARLAANGANRLPEPARRSAFMRFLLQFHNILIYALLGSAVITGLLEHYLDMAVILAVIIVNAVIGFIQEGRAEQAMAAIRRMLALRASVIRDGERRTVDGEALVPGDIVLLEAGDKAPADIRLISARRLQAQEAILTGESTPVEKSNQPVKADAPLGDRASMVFSGTLITSGEGRGVVVATGAESEIGRISGMLSEVEELTTPLIRQVNIFARWLTALILLVSALLLVFGYFVEHLEFAEVFMAVVSLAVAAIPEGLPAVLTITLAVGVQAMARRNAIVRRLPAIETLGSVSVICTDKTGTLTRNEMMVATVVTRQHVFEIEGAGYAPKGAVKLKGAEVDASEHAALEELARVATLCNDAALRRHDAGWQVEGDPMEGALLAFACKAGLDPQEETASWRRRDSIPFDARHRFMATLSVDCDNQAIIAVKGAPERILDMCSLQRARGGQSEPLDEQYWRDKAEEVARNGERVLAFAVKPAGADQSDLEFSDLERDLVFLGMMGLIDPPRPEAVEAVAECRRAGIRVKMITGDHKGTAAAIAREIGLENPDNVLTGADLDAMNDSTLAAHALETDVFARTSPEHKLRLVKALQAHGLAVAMSGDGVNDAPALKRAVVGVAMGKTGSEAAKEAAELVLADDNFATIVAAVRQGRTVYDNIKKVISWTLPTSTGEASTVMLALLLGLALPVTPVQILWVNLITAATLGLALAFEPTEANSMRRPPRRRDEPILTGVLIWHVVFVSVLFVCGVFGIYSYAMDRGYPIELARTLALNTLVVMEIFHLFFIRNIYGASLSWKAFRGTKAVWITVIIVTAAQFAVTYAPFLQTVFETRPVSFFDGVLVFSIGVTLFAIIEIEKQIRLSLSAPTLAKENAGAERARQRD